MLGVYRRYVFPAVRAQKQLTRLSPACIVSQFDSNSPRFWSVCLCNPKRVLAGHYHGLTPLIGLPGATRSAAVYPSLVFHYTNRAGRITHDPIAAVDVHVTQTESILNIESSWHAPTGTADFGESCLNEGGVHAGQQPFAG